MSSVIGTLIGRKMAPESLVSERLERCETCPFLAKNGRCTKCTCPVKDKAKYATIFHPRFMREILTHCPMGYWPYLDQAGIYHETDRDLVLLYRNMRRLF